MDDSRIPKRFFALLPTFLSLLFSVWKIEAFGSLKRLFQGIFRHFSAFPAKSHDQKRGQLNRKQCHEKNGFCTFRHYWKLSGAFNIWFNSSSSLMMCVLMVEKSVKSRCGDNSFFFHSYKHHGFPSKIFSLRFVFENLTSTKYTSTSQTKTAVSETTRLTNCDTNMIFWKWHMSRFGFLTSASKIIERLPLEPLAKFYTSFSILILMDGTH